MTPNTFRKTLIAVSVGLVLVSQAQAQGSPLNVRDAIDRLAAVSGSTPEVSVSEATGVARFIRAAKGARLDARGSSSAQSEADKLAVSQRFFRDNNSLFGIANVDTELAPAKIEKDRYGTTRLTRKQVYNGVPVLGGELKSHFDAAGNLTTVNGTFVPGINVNPNPTLTAEQASKIALALSAAQPDRAGKKLAAKAPELMIYRDGLTKGIAGASHLVWQVEVGNGNDVREFHYVDAHSSKIVDTINGIHDGMNRRAFDGQGKLPPVPNYPNNPYWVEGQGLPAVGTEARNMIDASGDIYALFKNAFGRDSFDGKGATMDSIFNRGDNCPNASWNGTYISFCPGTTTDDVTAHEWGHAYTEYTHGLIYSYQSGALNEAYSDIWGETVDRLNGRGGDTPDAARTNACAVVTNPPVNKVEITAPAAIAGVKTTGLNTFGPVNFNISGSVKGVEIGSGSAACAALPANSLVGKIAFIDRGTCAFNDKVKNAQDAGAIGVIIGNNQGGTVIRELGSAAPGVTIPAMSVTQNDGTAIKGQLANGVMATLSKTGGGVMPAYNNVRWLVGEDSTAFGGAIRDMYNPTCFGNPGKVSDTQYSCASADNGGVHGNSGVPNHGYALLVDGGDYNGQTIAGIGLTKAAHIYYRAQSVYQGPASSFADHADALKSSCKDLTNQPLNDLKTGNVSGEVITDSDCAQVDKMAAAVELRKAPLCGFGPILAKTPPALCTSGTATTLMADNFEGGRRGGLKWEVSYASANASFTPRNWSVISGLPGGRAGSAMISYHPNNGSCAPGQNQSGVQYLDSPEVVVPAEGLKLSFDHYVATETGWDGGNVKYSLNGGATWATVPVTAFVYNGYNTTITAASAGNDNPLQGQPGFSGLDQAPSGNGAGASWGRSIIDLSKLGGVVPGAKVRLRFASGNDGCGGVLGWIVDDVNVYSCKAAPL